MGVPKLVNVIEPEIAAALPFVLTVATSMTTWLVTEAAGTA